MTENKTILIIIRHFFPYSVSAGSVMRVLKMAEFFRENGIEVFILSGKGHEVGYFGYEKLVKNLNVTYVDDFFQRQITSNYLTEKRTISKSGKDKNFFLFTLKKAVNDLLVPDLGVLFYKQYIPIAAKLIETHHVHNVLVSSPYHSIQMVGLKLKQKFGKRINWIVDYRDSWNTTEIFTPRIAPLRPMSKQMERKILSASDHLSYVSPAILKKINEQICNVTEKAVLVMNGYDRRMKLDLPALGARNDVLTISYFGVLNDTSRSHRNPEILFRALKRFKKKIKLLLFGYIRINKAWEEQLDGILETRGNLSHLEAVKEMRRADVLMAVHTQKKGADEVVPGKVYDYMLAEKPIVIIGPTEMAASKLAKEHRLGYVIDPENEERILEGLDQIYQDWVAGTMPKYSIDDLKEYSRQHQFAKLLDILE